MKWLGILAGVFAVFQVQASEMIVQASDYGVKPDGSDASPGMCKLLSDMVKTSGKRTVLFEKGTYHFRPDSAAVRTLYISNHDQANPKRVGLPCENLKDVTLDAKGSTFLFHGRMIPVLFKENTNCSLKNVSIDFADPQILQLNVLDANKNDDSITAVVEGPYEIENGRFNAVGEGWKMGINGAIAFDGKTRHLLPQMSDISFTPSKIEELRPGVVKFHRWLGKRIEAGTRLALRSWFRPAPGVVVSHCLNSSFENVAVHYAEGMGFLGQFSENITLDSFRVCLRSENDTRYFTTQADATHFSGCKGLIRSVNGLYEGMMDDAINIHGTYLKVVKRVDDTTLVGRYIHHQSWGFFWGEPGDEVQFIKSSSMEITGDRAKIVSITPHNQKTIDGTREFLITFDKALPSEISEKNSFGIENLTWTPEVIFSNNIIRNNRARGALFSTPRKTVVENNFFDHTNGTGVLLCGDCNGWFETGACTDVIIRNNRFLNALTSNYGFTNAVISIYPEIPRLQDQKKFFHSGIVIENNIFETFDKPILYAKSVDGLVFRNNKIIENHDFKAFHWNKHRFFFERVTNVKLENNTFPPNTNLAQEIRLERSEPTAVSY